MSNKKAFQALAFLVALFTIFLTPAIGADVTSRQMDFDIKAQPLASALIEFSKQTQLQVMSQGVDLAKRQSSGVSGRRTIGQALEQLLTDTDLAFAATAPNTIAILPGVRTGSVGVGSGGEDAAGSRVAQAEMKAGAAEAVEQEEGEKLEEVVVTAQKRAERLQDVPMSMSAILAKELKEKGAFDVHDLLGDVPGLSNLGVQHGEDAYVIRGIANSQADPNASPSTTATTGIYLDDIPLPSANTIGPGGNDIVLFDMQRVEVLKGPQGTLYGGSAMGGAIKYVSALPDLSQFSSHAGIGVATTEHGALSDKTQAVVNIPIIPDTLAVRGGVYYSHQGGFIDNVAGLNIEDTAHSSTPYPIYTPLVQPSLSEATARNYNSADTIVGRLSLLWRPDPSWSIRPWLLIQDYDQAAPDQFFTNLSGLTSAYRVTATPSKDKSGIYGLDIKKNVGVVELSALTGYYERQFDWVRDYSYLIGYLIPPLYSFTSTANYITNQHAFSEEVHVSSANPDSRLQWLTGLYYQRQWQSFDGMIVVHNSPPPFNNFAHSYREATQDEYAGFGDATFQVVRGLKVNAGVRLYKINQAGWSQGRGGLLTPAGPVNTTPSDTTKGANPKFSLSYEFDKDHLLYASAAKGFRPGGAVPSGVGGALDCGPSLRLLGLSSIPEHYDSDSVWAYELGSKNQSADGRLMVNASLYYTNWTGIQQSIALPSCGGTFQANAGVAHIKGGEMETRLKMTSNLEIGGSFSYTNAKIVDPGLFSVSFHAGDPVQAAPKWIASVRAIYSLPLGDKWALRARADHQYRSSQLLSFSQTQPVTFSDGSVGSAAIPTHQQGYGVSNASLSMDNGKTNIRLYASNLFDKRPIIVENHTFGSTYAQTIRPRTIGLEVSHDF